MPHLLIDENIPRSTGKLLKEHGYIVEDIRDLGLRGISDEKILQFATKRRFVLLTGDMGFANIRRFPPSNHFGIVVAHFPNEMSTIEINRQIIAGLKNLAEEGFKSSLILMEPGKLRIRR